jgi:alkylation response protein AidB-like acyl-CoA dehydrogenase
VRSKTVPLTAAEDFTCRDVAAWVARMRLILTNAGFEVAIDAIRVTCSDGREVRPSRVDPSWRASVLVDGHGFSEQHHRAAVATSAVERAVRAHFEERRARADRACCSFNVEESLRRRKR